MAGMSMKEIARIVEHVEPQGVTVTRTKKGLLLRLPNHETTMVHFTTSDVRAVKNLRATLKRAGVTMPNDRHTAQAELAPYITNVTPTQRTKDRAQASLDKLGLRKVTTKQLVAAGGAPNVIQASQVLFALGWTPSKTTRNARRYWLAPVETDPEPIVLEGAEALTAMQHALGQPTLTAVEASAESETSAAGVVGGHAREFIDTAESWAAWDDLPGDMTLDQARRFLAALGMQGELRVWR